MITFPRFSVEFHPQCNFDFLQIHDGPSASSHMIGKYCGTQPPNGGHINSTHNQLYFWFKSDASIASDGFSVQWTSADPGRTVWVKTYRCSGPWPGQIKMFIAFLLLLLKKKLHFFLGGESVLLTTHCLKP